MAMGVRRIDDKLLWTVFGVRPAVAGLTLVGSG
jgi:hypothetical protein